jgi:hypothetical protein
MNWDLNSAPGHDAYYERVPEGSINFSTAEKPVVLISLQPPNADQLFASQVVEMTLVIESWCLYAVEQGRGFLRYSN